MIRIPFSRSRRQYCAVQNFKNPKVLVNANALSRPHRLIYSGRPSGSSIFRGLPIITTVTFIYGKTWLTGSWTYSDGFASDFNGISYSLYTVEHLNMNNLILVVTPFLVKRNISIGDTLCPNGGQQCLRMRQRRRRALRIRTIEWEGLLAPSNPRQGRAFAALPCTHPRQGAAAPWNPAFDCADNWLVGSTAATRLHGSNKRRCVTRFALML